MSFLYKPLIVFNSWAETGVDKIPLNSYVQIHLDKENKSRMILVLALTGFNSTTTVEQLLESENYVNVFTDGLAGGGLGTVIAEDVITNSYTVEECGIVLKINPTNIGSDCIINLPASPLDRCALVIINSDDANSNTQKMISISDDSIWNALSDKMNKKILSESYSFDALSSIASLTLQCHRFLLGTPYIVKLFDNRSSSIESSTLGRILLTSIPI